MTPAQLINELVRLTDNDSIQWSGSGYKWKASNNGSDFTLTYSTDGDQREGYWKSYRLFFGCRSSKESIQISETLGNQLQSSITRQEQRGKDKVVSAKMEIAKQALNLIKQREAVGQE